MKLTKKIILRIFGLLFINLIVLIVLIVFASIVPILNTNLNAAGSCTCNRDAQGRLFVVNNGCTPDQPNFSDPSGFTEPKCSSSGTSLANMTISCNCEPVQESQPGVNCVTSGLPPPGQTCCAGYTPESRSGACIPVGGIPVVPPPQQGKCATESINTAIGCIPVGNLSSFTGFLLGWGVGIGGGIAFILIVISGFMIMTASGNPERLQAGKELMTSAIMGLIMLIFSVFILKIIGVDILGISGIT